MNNFMKFAVGAFFATQATVALAQDDGITIGFLPGVVDPFYQVMELGVNAGAEDMGVTVVTQIPATWGVGVQVPILDAMIARGDLDYIVLAPTDKDQMVGPLIAALEAGIKIITVDTFIGDGDYANGPETFPISHIGSNNFEGGGISARALGERLDGEGSVYIMSTNPNVSSVEARAAGFTATMSKEYPNVEIVGTDFNLNDMNTAVQQTSATLERVPDLGGVFGTNVFSAQGAGTAVVNAGLAGVVEVVAYDATQFAIEQLREGTVSMVLAQKPYDMGYMAIQFAVADAAGVTSLPKLVETGFAIINSDNVDDPEVARFIYQVQ